MSHSLCELKKLDQAEKWSDSVVGFKEAKQAITESVILPIKYPQFLLANENDEIDSLCRSRSSNEDESTRRIKSQFLIELDGFCVLETGILFLCSTNRIEDLDEGILRRIDKKIKIKPDEEARFKILKMKVRTTKNSLKEDDYKILAKKTNGFSGSEIEKVVKDALLQPIRKIENCPQINIDRFEPDLTIDDMITPLSSSNKLKVIENKAVVYYCRLGAFYCVNYADILPNHMKQREGMLIKLLKSHKFSDLQQNNICKFVVQNHIQLTDQDLLKIDNSINFWKKSIIDKPLSTKDGTELIDHLYVLSSLEPSLLFIDLNEMKKRINFIQNSGFCDSKADVAKLFYKAPRGFFLQEWSDVILKAYYIHNRVVDWILNRKPCELYPHPIVKYPISIELPYDDIRARFLFAVNSGYRSKGLFQDISKATSYDVFRDLLVTDFYVYLDLCCKGLTEEEYLVYKEMIKIQLQEEDKIFKSLALMTNTIAYDSDLKI